MPFDANVIVLFFTPARLHFLGTAMTVCSKLLGLLPQVFKRHWMRCVSHILVTSTSSGTSTAWTSSAGTSSARASPFRRKFSMRVLIVSRSGPSSHCGYILAIARFLVHQVKSELSFGLAQAGGARPDRTIERPMASLLRAFVTRTHGVAKSPCHASP